MAESLITDYCEISQSTLVYDGDCAFCQYWVDYWRALTGPAINYQPYQLVAARYPNVPLADFAQSIFLFAPDGNVTRGAEAAFNVLATRAGHRASLWFYRHLPGYAGCTEAAYRVIARHRVAAACISRGLWGPQRVPASYTQVTALFLRLLGLIYLAAFASFGSQAIGLIGAHGITPLGDFLSAVHAQLGADAYRQLPTLVWLDSSDGAIRWLSVAGVAAAGLVALGYLQRLLLVLLFVLYLSLVYAGQGFMSFQWDLLLLEVGFAAILLPGGSALAIGLMRWVAFRFLVLAGAPKLLSGDPTWWGLTALKYHFETQPLPTPLAWYAHALPMPALRLGTGFALIVELVLPFLIVLPRRPRFLVAGCVFVFQLLITLTGNYNFFNLLTMLLCLPLLDDAALQSLIPARWTPTKVTTPTNYRPWARGALALCAAWLVTLGVTQLYEQLTRRAAWSPLHALYVEAMPFNIVNGYGLFAHMTTSRPEIVIEGSNDLEHWRAYEFRYKPGGLEHRPGWNIPHQPRLDWQLWFAALGSASENPWFGNLLVRLLEGTPEVLALLAENPFPDHPPRYVRARLFDYHFTTYQARRETGQWWRRELLGDYFPVISL